MIDHVWTVVCSHAVIDKDSNNVSLLDIVEQLNIREEPSPKGGIIFPLDIMTLWSRADFDVPARGRGRVTFLSPSGTINDGPFEYDVDLSEHHRNRTKGSIRALHVSEPGRYVFQVELQGQNEAEWHQVAAIPLEINFLPPDENEQPENESD